jgi:hypothetical protein
MTKTQIAYSPTTGTTSDLTRDTRARAWAFVIDSYAKKEAAPESRPDDVKEVSNDSRRTASIQQR